MNTKTRQLTMTALMIALTLILGLTPLGFLKLPFLGIDITLMCLPVIIGTILLGWRAGLLLGLVFGLTSLYTAFTAPSPLLAPLVRFPLALYPSIFIPRLLIPVVTWLVFQATKRLPKGIGVGITAAAGSLANTVFFLGFVYVLGAEQLAKNFSMTTGAVGTALALVVVTNGLPEMAAAILLCIPIVLALNKVLKKEP